MKLRRFFSLAEKFGWKPKRTEDELLRSDDHGRLAKPQVSKTSAPKISVERYRAALRERAADGQGDES